MRQRRTQREHAHELCQGVPGPFRGPADDQLHAQGIDASQ